MTECYFTPNKHTTSATICANCLKDKSEHTVGEGIKCNEIIICTSSTQSSTIKDQALKDLIEKQNKGLTAYRNLSADDLYNLDERNNFKVIADIIGSFIADLKSLTQINP